METLTFFREGAVFSLEHEPRYEYFFFFFQKVRGLEKLTLIERRYFLFTGMRSLNPMRYVD